MVKITTKETTTERDNIDNKIELQKFTTEVKSRIADTRDVTSDFVLSILGEKDKEMTIEMTQNAQLVKKLINIHQEAKEWKWNEQERKWEETQLSKEDKRKISEIADRTFDTIMVRIQMIQVVNRNKPKNPILRILGGLTDPTDEEEQQATIEEYKAKLKEAMKIKGDNGE